MCTVKEFRDKLSMYENVAAVLIEDDDGEVSSDKLMRTNYEVYIIIDGYAYELLDDDPIWEMMYLD